MGVAESRETGDGGMDAYPRIGRAPGSDGPLMRAALNGSRIPMMELLVSRGAEVNALWHGHFPIIFAPCESMDPASLKWLLDHGANPNCRDHGYEISGHPYPGTALDYLIAGYARSVERLGACIDLLLQAGGETRYDAPAVMALLRGRLDSLAEQIDADPALVSRRFSELDCGMSGGRCLTLQGERSCMWPRNTAISQRPLCSSTVGPTSMPAQQSTMPASVRAKLPGDYERPGEIVESTALGYALLFGGTSRRRTVTLLRERGAVE
jgi:hypothetical protein